MKRAVPKRTGPKRAAPTRAGPHRTADGAPPGWQALLDTCAPWEARQAEALRAAVAAAFPGARQAFKGGWRAVTFADESVGFVCGVFVRPGGPSLYFENGAALDDPDGLFTRRMARTAAADFPRGTRIARRKIAAMVVRSVVLGAVGRRAEGRW